MSSKETVHIAFPYGGILPAGIAGEKDRPVGPHEPVRVPKSYGDSLVEDRFAYVAEPKKKPREKSEKPDLGALEQAVKQVELDLDAASDDDARSAAAAALELARSNLTKASV